MKTINYPIAILLASFVLGGFYYASEANKQKFAEKQLEVEYKAKTQEQTLKQVETVTNTQKLEQCLKNADDNYQANFESYCISEGRGPNCLSIKRYNNDAVLAIEKDEKTTCFSMFPQK